MKWRPSVEFLGVVAIIAIAVLIALNIGPPAQDAQFHVVKPKETITTKPSIQNQRLAEGRSLFKSNCAACHNPVTDGTGPALRGATARWKAAGSYQGKTGEQWMHIWVHNWHDAVNAGYKYAVDMKNSRASEMNVFPNLKFEEIDDIMFYIDSADLNKPLQKAISLPENR